MEWFGAPATTVAGVGVGIVLLGLLIAWGVRRLEADERREREATRLQERRACGVGRRARGFSVVSRLQIAGRRSA